MKGKASADRAYYICGHRKHFGPERCNRPVLKRMTRSHAVATRWFTRPSRSRNLSPIGVSGCTPSPTSFDTSVIGSGDCSISAASASASSTIALSESSRSKRFGDPEREAIDDRAVDHAGERVECGDEIERLLDDPPVRWAVGAMASDARRHVGVARLRGGHEGDGGTGYLRGYREATLAAPSAAENEGRLLHRPVYCES